MQPTIAFSSSKTKFNMDAVPVLKSHPPPCPILASLYQSQRPEAFLIAGTVHLAPVILSCCPDDHKAMLAENWTPRAAEQTNAQQQPPAFNPAAPEYNELARRVSQSAAMGRWNELTIQAKRLEKQLPGLTGEAKEAKQQEHEEVQQQLADSHGALSDLQASFEQDPLSLVPWMGALFALADSGCSTFDAGGGGWPPSPRLAALGDLLGPSGAAAAVGGPAAVSGWLCGGAERVLGAFKRRYEAERGPGARLTVFTRLALHCFGEAGPAELAAAVEGAVERSRQAVLGPDAAAAGAALDLVQLHWMDFKERDFLPVLLELARLARPRHQPADDGSGALVVAEPARVAAIGLVEPPAEAVTAALRAGVPLACVSVPYSLLDVSAAPLLQLCRSLGIKVFAAGALAHGLISEAFVGVAQPNTAAAGGAGADGSSGGGGAAEALGPDNLAAGLSMVARYGGWARFQQLLVCLQAVARKHGVSMEVVALRWLIDQGTFPVTAARWSAAAGPWATFGHTYGLTPAAASNQPAAAGAGNAAAVADATAAATAKAAEPARVLGGGGGFVPGIDAALFQVSSFLDQEDVAALGALCGAAAADD